MIVLAASDADAADLDAGEQTEKRYEDGSVLQPMGLGAPRRRD